MRQLKARVLEQVRSLRQRRRRACQRKRERKIADNRHHPYPRSNPVNSNHRPSFSRRVDGRFYRGARPCQIRTTRHWTKPRTWCIVQAPNSRSEETVCVPNSLTAEVTIARLDDLQSLHRGRVPEKARRACSLSGHGTGLWRSHPTGGTASRILPLERAYTSGYDLHVLPMVFNGDFHVHFYRGLDALVQRFRPDIVHMDEEPYNLATFQAMRSAQRHGAGPCSSPGRTCCGAIRLHSAPLSATTWSTLPAPSPETRRRRMYCVPRATGA